MEVVLYFFFLLQFVPSPSDHNREPARRGNYSNRGRGRGGHHHNQRNYNNQGKYFKSNFLVLK